MPVIIEGSKGVNGGAAEFKSFTFGVVGDRRNLSMAVPTASNTATLVGDAHILSSASGDSILCKDFSLNIDLTSSGAGGMAQGQTSPVSGFLAIWHIYNPSSMVQALVATDCTGTKIQEVLSPAMLPSGFLYSALVTILPTDPARKIEACLFSGRKVSIGSRPLLVQTSSQNSGGVIISALDKIPRNSKKMSVVMGVGATTSLSAIFILRSGDSIGSPYFGDAVNISYIASPGNVAPLAHESLELLPSFNLQMYAYTYPVSGSFTFSAYVSGYEI